MRNGWWMMAALLITFAAEAAEESKVVTGGFPKSVLTSIAGCWQFSDKERLTFTATTGGGAEVVRSNIAWVEPGDSYARRAAIPSEVMYDTSDGSLAFTTAGHIHGAMFIFRLEQDSLAGDWYSSRDPGKGYHWTGGHSKLTRCP